MRRDWRRILSVVVLAAASIANAATPGTQTLEGRVMEQTLSNGIKVLLVERHQAPIVAFNMTYKVGSVHEQNGITGIAHLYEHMAFKGTPTLGTSDYGQEAPLLSQIEALNEEMTRAEGSDPARLDQLRERFAALQEAAQEWVVANEMGEIYERNGAVGLNASTGRDVTSYVISLPANRLPLWVAIESDRMAHPVLREFYKERDVVLEERRRSVETNPSGKLAEAFYATAFMAHPYGTPTLGWPSDVGTLSATRTQEFFKTHYVPNNTIISIVGDIQPSVVLPLLERAFGAIPAGPLPPRVVTVEPPQTGERRVEIEADAHPQLLIGYHKPGIADPDDAVFDVIDILLSDGRSSRLYKKLVDEQKIVTGVATGSGSPGARFSNLFTVSATPRAPHTPEEVEAAIYEELERLKSEPVSADELSKVMAHIDAALVRSLQSNSGLASGLAYFEAVAGSWRYTLRNREAIAKVTPDDILRVARTYFAKKNRVVATLVHNPLL
jgi:predicted Zn-dependent peptidase